MFDKFKKLQELKKMQDEFKKEKMTVEKRGVSVVMNGNMEIEEIKLNPELSTEDQQEAIKQCVNEARESVQKKLASALASSGMNFGL